MEGARKEVWAYGLRNPHRLTWDVDPSNASRSQLLASSIGLHYWETVYVIRKGANYGYSEREGHQRMTDENRMVDRPVPDEIPVRVSDTVTKGTIVPTYAVLEYPHAPDGGDAIAGGFVYRGSKLPALRGKFIFGDISTGKLWYADYGEMLKADDGKPDTMAARHEVHIRWTPPGGTRAAGVSGDVSGRAGVVPVARRHRSRSSRRGDGVRRRPRRHPACRGRRRRAVHHQQVRRDDTGGDEGENE